MTPSPGYNPSRKQLVVFALLLIALAAVLARAAIVRPQAFLIGAIATGAAWLLSLTLNRESSRRSQLSGIAIPLVFAALWWLARTPAIGTIVWVLIGIGAIAALVSVASQPIGAACYRAWMLAAAPIGWTFTRIILGAVFFLVITPIGLILRLAGRDPLERRFDRAAATYWKPHRQATDPGEYFRQS